MAAFLAGDLAEQQRHGQLAVELARAAAGQEGLALALTTSSMAAIAGAGIHPATMAALDEAATVLAAHPDRFIEAIMRRSRAELLATLGRLEAAETEVGLCWAAGRSGAFQFVEFAGPLAEARLAAARDDTEAPPGRCAGRLTADAALGASCSFPSPWPAWRAWPPAPVTSPRRQPRSPRRAPNSAAAARRSPSLRCATPKAS